MKERARWSLDRARTELAAARHLASGGFGTQALSRAYYAAFYAAEACLGALGETRSKHASVIAVFVQRVVRPGGFDSVVAQQLRLLFDRRNEADYAAPTVTPEVVAASLNGALRFVQEAERWIAAR